MMEPRRGWTIHLVRQDGLETHTVRLGRTGVTWAIAGLAVVLLGVGLLLGRAWQRGTESAETRALEAEVAQLTSRQADVADLTARLERIESDYRRLQRGLGGEVRGGAGNIVLPDPGSSPRSASLEDAHNSTPGWPLAQRGFVTRTFGSHTEGSRTGHRGIDIAVPLGSYVRATQPGIVEEAGRDTAYGFFVRIAHEDGFSSLYGHNSWLFVAPGDSVDRLQVIALSGNTGRSTAPHLHFEIDRDGEWLDPLTYVADTGAGEGGVPGRNGVEQR